MSRRWHHESIFGPGPQQPLDRNQRARWQFLIDAHHRAGRLTRAARDIARALLRRLGVNGQCDPSHATLAADAACTERTVRNTLRSLRRLGLLNWVRRLVRDGSRVEQTSNAYVLTPSPANPAIPAERLRGGNFCRETPREILIPASAGAVAEAKEALRLIRVAREKRIGLRA